MTFNTNFDAALNSPAQDIPDETTALLIRARAFLERGWCRHNLAQDAEGNSVEPTDKRAVSWCAFGALLAAGCPLTSPPQTTDTDPWARLQAVMGGPTGNFNDAQETVEPVLAAFDLAISQST
jgi:hypothetical protein